jgi:hypothetical protein
MKRALALAAATIAVGLALVGCGTHARASGSLNQAAHTTSTAPASRTAPAGGTTSGSDSTAAQLASVDGTLNGLTKTLAGIDSQISQADKAADNDN